MVKEWRRGTPLESARLVFEGKVEDMSVGAYSAHTPEGRYDVVYRTPEFFRGINYLVLDGRLVKLDVPDDVETRGIFKNQMLLSLRTDWTVGGKTYPQDALLAIDLDRFLAGERDFAVLFQPEERVALDGVSTTRNHLLLTTLDNVRGRLYRLTPGADGWSREEIPLPGLGSVGVGSTSEVDDTFFFTYNDFLTPTSLYLVRPGAAPERIKSTPAFFDAAGMTVDQYEATSKDGTKIPYFVFMPKGFTARRPEPDPALRLRRLRADHESRLLGR